MLQLENVTITQEKDLHVLVNDLSLTIQPGDKVAIIGEEGTGKSTLLQALYDRDRVASYASVEGKVHHHFASLAYLPQTFPPDLLELSIADFLYESIDYQRFDFACLYQMAGQLRFPAEELERNDKTVAQLSGGEKIKLALLKLLAYQPDLLLLDEPSSDLDMETLKWLETFIHDSQQTIIFISHDERLLENTATAILHLELVKKRKEARATFYKGSYQSYKQERLTQFERQLQRAKKEREEHDKRMTKSHRIHQSVEHQLRNTKSAPAGRLLAKKLNTILAQEKRYEKEARSFTEIPEDTDAIHLFFSEIQPLAEKKKLLHWQKKNSPLDNFFPLHYMVAIKLPSSEKMVLEKRDC